MLPIINSKLFRLLSSNRWTVFSWWETTVITDVKFFICLAYCGFINVLILIKTIESEIQKHFWYCSTKEAAVKPTWFLRIVNFSNFFEQHFTFKQWVVSAVMLDDVSIIAGKYGAANFQWSRRGMIKDFVHKIVRVNTVKLRILSKGGKQ
ncbi:hypothetical protein BGC07_17545 [Piscirickettsia litoralis]|uniref:Uncharacterized protein n=2 Tax=Piscirickettsia litoralis TaxID=1891921 RepID=A0ABX2ZXL1_9GAMM|nr:hypothetical protein BGC07_17545 [Piscirickettsia litoralis]